MGSPRIVHGGVAGLAGVALERGQPERAALLLGAVEAARQSTGGVRIAYAWQSEWIETQTRAALGEAGFLAAWNAGRQTAFDEALLDALTLATEPEPEPEPRQPSGPTVDLSGHAARQHQDLERQAPGMVPASSIAGQSGLTPREHEVLRLLVQGRTDREIAAALSIGQRTAQTHVANLFNKLGVNSRAECTAVAVRRGLA